MEKEKKVKDVDFADSAVPSSARKNVVTMFMIMLGFTFFSASMWVGQQLADGLDFWGFFGITNPWWNHSWYLYRSARLRRCKNRSVT